MKSAKVGCLFAALIIAFDGMEAQAQRLGGAPDSAISPGRIALSLVVCIATAVGLALIVRAKSPPGLASVGDFIKRGAGAHRRIERVESVRLSLQTEVHLLRCDDVEYLLVCGPGGNQVVDRRDLGPSYSAREQAE